MKYLWALVIFVAGELVSFLIFTVIKKQLGPPETSPAMKASTAKGVLERLVLFIGLIHGFPQILIAFGALKLGTRLHEEKESEISNNYFLVGNLISILLAMLYAIITEVFWTS